MKLIRFFIFSVFLYLAVFPLFSQQFSRQPSYNESLIGNKKGLFAVSTLASIPLWTEGSVEKILYADGWFFLTSQGILFSTDLKTFKLRNEGLPVNAVKQYDGKTKTFVHQVRSLKDLEILPGDPKTLVTLTKNEVFISRDGGIKWKSLGFSAKTSGGKAVAAAMLPQKTPSGIQMFLTVFLSHPVFGLSYIHPDVPGARWIDINKGFEKMPSLTSPDEIADIFVVSAADKNGIEKTEVYISQTFIPRLYRLDWEQKAGQLIAKGTEPADTWESLTAAGNDLVFISLEGLILFHPLSGTVSPLPYNGDKIKRLLDSESEVPRCAWFPPWISGLDTHLALSELWLSRPETIQSDYSNMIEGKKSIYVPAGQVLTKAGLEKFSQIITANKLNSLVIDMKDDYGLLRYQSNDPLVQEKGKKSQYALDLDSFIETFKKQNTYLIARIVVFKDRNLYRYANGKYAIWDKKTNGPWLGTSGTANIVDDGGTITGKRTLYYDEHWVDPYSEEVWEYNVTIAKELIVRGFDEIQFDYIRFPTDGQNIDNTQYRWHDPGMDMESALISFLAYARKNIASPIGVDIYGANGWYRSGARTGQDVELMAPYVDVISPMFYPSHFEQIFLAYAPLIERPYRVYFYGTYRNSVLARNQVLVRPWVQAFYLNVSYDRQFYNKDYVQRQIYGVRDALDKGYMYWNNAGRYTDLNPDIGSVKDQIPYPWEKSEYDKGTRLPALSGFLPKE